MRLYPLMTTTEKQPPMTAGYLQMKMSVYLVRWYEM